MSYKQFEHEPQHNELDRRLLGVQGLNPFDGANSASRKQMFSSHMTQKLVLFQPSVKKIQTGMEIEYGKYTFANKMPENGKILKVFTRYESNQFVADGFKISPESIAVYESEDGIISYIVLEKYFSLHPQFGFEYKDGPDKSKLYPDQFIAKDEVFADTPCKGPNGEYNYGIELNMAFMSHPSVSEDGIGISRDVLPKLRFKMYEKRTIEWGRDLIPLNLYGDDNKYKIFPDIGDYVHPNHEHKGLLMALREYNPALAGLDTSREALKILDPIFDDCTYARGEGGRVVDVVVYHQPLVKGETICDEMMEQPIKYRDALLKYRQDILNFYFQLKAKRPNLKISPSFQRYIVECMAITNHLANGLKQGLQLNHKKKPLNEWRAEFVIEYEVTPNIGSKLTDSAGATSSNFYR